MDFSFDFDENVRLIDKKLRVDESFDIIKREMEISSKRVVMYYIDGFVTAAIMQKLMMHLTSVKDFGDNTEGSAIKFAKTNMPSVEVDPVFDVDTLITMVLS